MLPTLPTFLADAEAEAEAAAGGYEDGAGRLAFFVSKRHPVRGTIGRSLVVDRGFVASYEVDSSGSASTSTDGDGGMGLGNLHFEEDGGGVIDEGRETNRWMLDRLCSVRSNFCDNACLVSLQVRNWQRCACASA
jgi:hypothetical protein